MRASTANASTNEALDGGGGGRGAGAGGVGSVRRRRRAAVLPAAPAARPLARRGGRPPPPLALHRQRCARRRVRVGARRVVGRLVRRAAEGGGLSPPRARTIAPAPAGATRRRCRAIRSARRRSFTS